LFNSFNLDSDNLRVILSKGKLNLFSKLIDKEEQNGKPVSVEGHTHSDLLQLIQELQQQLEQLRDSIL